MSERICTDCQRRPVHARGLCASCYSRRWSNDTLPPLALENQDELDFAGWDAWLADNRGKLENTFLLVQGGNARIVRIQREP